MLKAPQCRSTFGRGDVKNVEMSKTCTPLWRKAHVEVKVVKSPHVRTALGSWDVEKAHGVVVVQVCTNRFSSGALLAIETCKKCTPLWREAHVEVKTLKTHHVQTTFGGCDVGKVHADVARSAFGNKHAKDTTCSDHFWRFRCWKSIKSTRGCGARRVLKWKC